MTVELRPSTCPRCDSTVPTIFIRSEDQTDLICGSCRSREGHPSRQPTVGTVGLAAARVFPRSPEGTRGRR